VARGKPSRPRACVFVVRPFSTMNSTDDDDNDDGEGEREEEEEAGSKPHKVRR